MPSVWRSSAKVSLSACVCDAGYELVDDSCSACSKGSYKSVVGSGVACLPCPAGFTTFGTGARFESFCAIPTSTPDSSSPSTGNNGSNVSNETNQSAVNVTDLPISPQPQIQLKNETAVPAVTFNMTMSQLPADGDEETLKNQLKAALPLMQ